MHSGQPLTEDELDELDTFLISDEMPEECMDISTLDGFLAAIVLNPDLIMPSQWLPWVWDMENGEEAPEFATMEQATRIMGFVMRHYDTVQRSINEGWFDPLLFELAQTDGSEFLDAEGWCAGFMLGVSMFIDPLWRPVLEKHTDLIAPMVLLGTEKGWKVLEASGNYKTAAQEAYAAIPMAVAALYAYFQPWREQAANKRVAGAVRSGPGAALSFRRGAEKVGRNDPCPCGSGKKFKKCCGADTLH
ncbi:MAG: UPF0149 family protein [Burkholderiales bacterium]